MTVAFAEVDCGMVERKYLHIPLYYQNPKKRKPMPQKGPVVLVILDGFGYRPSREGNAIAQAYTPHLTSWLASYPHTLLHAAGSSVGLPSGYMGNSEVGHLTIGAGRTIPQPLTLINKAIEQGSLQANPVLIKALAKVKATSNRLHFIGLLSDAGIHSDIKHLQALLAIAQASDITSIFLHLFLDGRDTNPTSASLYLNALSSTIHQTPTITLGSLHGRFYAMDRDKHYDRTQQSYRVLTGQTDQNSAPWQTIIQENYAQGVTDEFITPTLLDKNGALHDGDGIIFFNIRPDRIRQLAASLLDQHFSAFPTKQYAFSCCLSLVDYGLQLPLETLLPVSKTYDTLKDVLAQHGKRIFTIAETEKYAHVTYFFNGMREEPVAGETRVLIPSLPVRTYENDPAMSAPAITEAVVATLSSPYDFYLINYANADMVGHSGNMAATIKAIECLDTQLGILYDAFVAQRNGTLFVTADHGNAEEMLDAQGQPKTSHTTNDVPFFIITKDSPVVSKLPLTTLADIAPYILHMMGLPIPSTMHHKK